MRKYVYFKTDIAGFRYKIKKGRWIPIRPGIIYKAEKRKLDACGLGHMDRVDMRTQVEKLMCIKDKNVEVLP